MSTIGSQKDTPAAGKNISVYLSKELLSLIESSGRSPSQLIQEALRKYFIDANRQTAAQKVVKISRTLGKADRFAETISEWQHDREKDRW